MFKLLPNLTLLFLFALTTAPFIQKVNAEEDAVEDEEDDEEGEVEDEEGVVEEEGEEEENAPSAVDEEDEAEVITAHREADTNILFSTGAEPVLIAGKKMNAFIHFANTGSNNFIITSVDASFRYPQDFSYVIQNFTVIAPNKMIDAGKEGSFNYLFTPGELSGGRSFGLIFNVNYKDAEDNIYRDAVYNQTIQVLENEEGVDAETFFMTMMLCAVGALLVLGLYHTFGSKTKRSKKRNTASASSPQSPVEMGTTNGPVDYQWIPEETIKAMSKNTPSPRRSPRKRASRKSAGSE